MPRRVWETAAKRARDLGFVRLRGRPSQVWTPSGPRGFALFGIFIVLEWALIGSAIDENNRSLDRIPTAE